MLTISRLSRWSINYYNDTANQAKQAAMDRRRAGGGLGEYYTEADTRVPTWLVAGDAAAVGELTGLDGAALAGGFADTAVAARWLDEGIAPNGSSGRVFAKGSVHGLDLTFAAPKSVSLVRALTNDLGEKMAQAAHLKAVHAAMTYLHEHAGYTRVHNPLTGAKDLQRLPSLVAIAYQHETSRCGDPHLHTHVIVPNRQARADGVLVAIDSKSLYHEAKAAGVIYQAVLRHELHAERGFEWSAVDERTGMAEIAGVTADCITDWSQRATRLREWAANNLAVVDGKPTAAQTAAAQKATRPAKPESLAWADLAQRWRADARGLVLDRGAHLEARAARRASAARTRAGARSTIDRARVARMAAHIDKAAFTRADLVEIIGAQLPVDAPDPRRLIEDAVDAVAMRLSAPRQAHEREGHVKYTLDVIIAEEERIFDMCDAVNNRARLWLRDGDLDGLSPGQASAVASIAASPFLVQPLQAPAGAGKTHSLKALRAAAHHVNKEVLVLAPTGKAVDEAMRQQAGDRGLTVAKALHLIEHDGLDIASSMVVIDEAAMVGTAQLRRLLAATTAANVKTVLVGDPHQLAPVKARGGMFEQLCTELPWSQRLTEVWRLRDRAERDTSLALRCGHGNRLRKAVGWYRAQDRLHTGDPIAMATDAHAAYLDDRAAGKNALLVCDTWEMADALNQRLHDALTSQGPAAGCAREQTIRAGDIIISRHNDASLDVRPAPGHDRVDQVRNSNRWRVAAVDQVTNRIAAERLTDRARVVFEGDYLHEHVHLGYAVTVHSAQGVTADTAHAVIGQTASRALAYVAMTRGREYNHAYIYTREPGEAESHHHHVPDDGEAHQLRRGTKYFAAHYFRMILANDDRPRTMHAEAERTAGQDRQPIVTALLERNEQRRRTRQNTWRQHTAAERAWHAAYERIADTAEHSAERSRSRDQGYGLEL